MAQVFCDKFKNAEYLSLTMFLDYEGRNCVTQMFKPVHLSNVCHVGVTANILMMLLSNTFNKGAAVFSMSYSLYLPHSYGPLAPLQRLIVATLPSLAIPPDLMTVILPLLRWLLLS